MLVMSHYPDLGTYRASDWLKIFQTSRKIISSPVFQAALYVLLARSFCFYQIKCIPANSHALGVSLTPVG